MSDQKKRHGCLTTYLIFMLFSGSFAILFNLQSPQIFKQLYPDTPDWVFLFSLFLAVLNIICTIALFCWKKWGFWLYVVSVVIASFLNLLYFEASVLSPLFALVAIALIYAVLQIGKEKNGWSQLE